MRVSIAVIVILLASVDPVWSQSTQGCVSYEPTILKLTGVVVRRTFAGPPNYESIREGDRPETYWVLVLPRSICINGIPGDLVDVPKHHIGHLQLVFESEKPYQQYRHLLGKRIVATGTLFGAITGHHHTSVLLKVGHLEKLGSRYADHSGRRAGRDSQK